MDQMHLDRKAIEAFTPTSTGYHFRGRVATGELIAGAVNGPN